MRFDTAALVEEVLWDMRIAEEPRAADRALILRQFNGAPPFDEATAEDNNIQINVNDLEGTNVLAKARRQWNNAFLKPANFFIARTDSGPAHKRSEWSQIATRNANRLLKRSRKMVGQIRATGANTLLYGIAPVMWKDRRSVIPGPVPVGSLLIPSETEIDDFDESLQYFAVFREWTPTQLWEMTHGPRVDPGWNMPLVKAQLEYVADELRKSPNALAYQYMPERIEELIKQDKGFFGSDATPTVDVWDFYFREAEDGAGWYRRIVLDWGVGADVLARHIDARKKPDSRGKDKDGKETFLYSSGKRKYAMSSSEILHLQVGDCSPYAPVKYHSLRGLGWMLWGICDLQNRLHCKFNEAVFEQLMWFFQTAGNTDMVRLKKVLLEHMGVIPQGIKYLTANERFVPNQGLIEMAFARNERKIADSSTSYTQDFERSSGGQARTATETMALVNASQALASGVIEEAYTYEAFKDTEIFRRLNLKGSKDTMAAKYRLGCLRDGMPEEMLDAERWYVEPEQVIGGGNKTAQMATVQFLQSIRKNLPPNGQRLVDNLSIGAATDIPELAEEMAPLGETRPISNSQHDAQEATPRLLRGLEFRPPKDAIFEDYVIVWLHDGNTELQRIFKRGGTATMDELTGLANISKHVRLFLGQMAQGAEGKGEEESKQKLREYGDMLKQYDNHVKGLLQRFQQQAKAQAQQAGQGGGNGAETAAKVQAMLIQANSKAQIADRAAQQRTAQKQLQWEAGERRKDMQIQADLQREGVKTRHDLLADRMKALAE